MALEKDVDFARKLQNMFDEEVQQRKIQEERDKKLAHIIASKSHDISDSDDDPQPLITPALDRHTKGNSSDSDRTLDPDEEPDLFHEKSKQLSAKNKETEDTDSDVTVDLSPEKVAEKSISKDEMPKTKRKRTSSSRSPGCSADSPVPYKYKKSSSKDHAISDSDSDYNMDLVAVSPKKTIVNSSSSVSPKDKLSSSRTIVKTPDKGHSSQSSEHRTESHGNHLRKSPGKKSKSESKLEYSSPQVTKNHKKYMELSDSDDSDATVDLEPEEKDDRPLCLYGSKCYRKNPSHLAEFQHAGKSPKGKSPSSAGSPTKKKRKLSPERSPSQGTSSTQSLAASDVLKHAGPIQFFLTKVVGIPKNYNDKLALHIKDILSPSMGNLVKSAQFNYMTDIPWLVAQYPVKFRTKPLLIVHGSQRAQKAALDNEAAHFDHVKLCQAKLEIMYGTHHTKMMFLQYDNGLRIVIHTSNLIEQDWHQKTQGIWVSSLFPKLPSESSTGGESPTHFKRDLLEYLAAYKARPLEEWMKIIREHNLSSAQVYLIGSIPGRHTGEKKHAFGHLKLRKVLKEHGPTPLHVKNWPVIGQFSSIGSLGAQKEAWVCSEWLESLSASKGSIGSKANLKLIYPTKDNVRLSLEGFPAGGSLPYSINTAKKQPWLRQLLYQWKSNCRGRSRASPHIKTYMRLSPDSLNIAWFLCTSANLSKAAWGALEKSGSQLMIRSYELGVLFLPEKYGSMSSFRAMKSTTESLVTDKKQLVLPVPYDLPPAEYTQQDRPWIWDIPYVDKPDTNGNMWCPP